MYTPSFYIIGQTTIDKKLKIIKTKLKETKTSSLVKLKKFIDNKKDR